MIRSNSVQLFASKSDHHMVENQKRKQDKIQRTHRGECDEVTESASLPGGCVEKSGLPLWGRKA